MAIAQEQIVRLAEQEELLTGCEAIAQALRLADVDLLAAYPIRPYDGVMQAVAKLPPNSFIFVLLLLRDASGVTHNADEALQHLHQVANAPISGFFNHQLGLGIVGGRLYDAERVGKEAADIAVRILRGAPASGIPPILLERLAPRYDSRELQRWKIHEKLLPKGSTLLFRAPTLWEQHRTLILGVVTVCVLQALLISVLVVNLVNAAGRSVP